MIMKEKIIAVNDKMQTGYRYRLTARPGENLDTEFKPELTPKQMLEMGIFGGIYMRDCHREFPKDWFARAKFQKNGYRKRDPKLNYFGVNASQPLAVWRKKGWIHPADPRGWFQWYCRYYLGRRLPEEDARQIKRWRAMKRHIAQIKKHCAPGDLACRRIQRQALLHWAYDSRKI
jgi:hypothetical protein